MTTIPYDPAECDDDGRMYPPLAANTKVIPGPPVMTRYRLKSHIILIGENGAINILRVGVTEPLLSKPGRDGVKLP